MHDKPPSTIKECLKELIYVIEASKDLEDIEQKANLLDAVRISLMAYLKLKEYIQE